MKSSESVTQGHPDKMCDQIADAILDEFLRRDPSARVNIGVFGSRGMLVVGGEIRSTADFDLAGIARHVYAQIGYEDEIEVFANVDIRPPDASGAVRTPAEAVVVNGYASAETREFLPRPFVLATNLVRRLDDLRRTSAECAWLLPDGKAQVVTDRARTVSVTVRAAHAEYADPRDVQAFVLDRVVGPVVGELPSQVFVNPSGPCVRAGFAAAAGAGGQKVSADFYGGLIPHGDATLSGKDPGRPERAGAYAARAAARFLVEQGLASSALVTLVYSPGRAEPVRVDASGVSQKSRGSKMDYANLVRSRFDFRPEAIVERFDLLRPIYQQTAAYGHFGRLGFPWEETGR